MIKEFRDSLTGALKEVGMIGVAITKEIFSYGVPITVLLTFLGLSSIGFLIFGLSLASQSFLIFLISGLIGVFLVGEVARAKHYVDDYLYVKVIFMFIALFLTKGINFVIFSEQFVMFTLLITYYFILFKQVFSSNIKLFGQFLIGTILVSVLYSVLIGAPFTEYLLHTIGVKI